MAAAVWRISTLGQVKRRSSLYSTEPVGIREQPRYLNAVITLDTGLTPRALLECLLGVEKEYGRDRTGGIPKGPRTLDLDILLYGNVQIREPGLEIPHPRVGERAFVLVPLNEIAPEIVIPGHSTTVAQMLQTLVANGESDADAVVRVESDVWRAGADGNPPGTTSALRTGGG